MYRAGCVTSLFARARAPLHGTWSSPSRGHRNPLPMPVKVLIQQNSNCAVHKRQAPQTVVTWLQQQPLQFQPGLRPPIVSLVHPYLITEHVFCFLSPFFPYPVVVRILLVLDRKFPASSNGDVVDVFSFDFFFVDLFLYVWYFLLRSFATAQRPFNFEEPRPFSEPIPRCFRGDPRFMKDIFRFAVAKGMERGKKERTKLTSPEIDSSDSFAATARVQEPDALY